MYMFLSFYCFDDLIMSEVDVLIGSEEGNLFPEGSLSDNWLTT